MSPQNQTTSRHEQPATELRTADSYEHPEVRDYGSLRELTLVPKSGVHADVFGSVHHS